MARDIRTMEQIQDQKKRDLAKENLIPLNPEGRRLAEHKRFTFDVIETPVDPLR